jgi:hypothetical protein
MKRGGERKLVAKDKASEDKGEQDCKAEHY